MLASHLAVHFRLATAVQNFPVSKMKPVSQTHVHILVLFFPSDFSCPFRQATRQQKLGPAANDKKENYSVREPGAKQNISSWKWCRN
jgi:hypothetical protein